MHVSKTAQRHFSASAATSRITESSSSNSMRFLLAAAILPGARAIAVLCLLKVTCQWSYHKSRTLSVGASPVFFVRLNLTHDSRRQVRDHVLQEAVRAIRADAPLDQRLTHDQPLFGGRTATVPTRLTATASGLRAPPGRTGHPSQRAAGCPCECPHKPGTGKTRNLSCNYCLRCHRSL